MTRTIITCPGIGDTIWLFMKLVNQPESFHWKIGDGTPQRGHQIFKLFPQLTESFEYIPENGYKTVKRSAYKGSWSKAPQKFYLEANSHLEQGKRIEQFLPDLETRYKLCYDTMEEDSVIANRILGFDALRRPDGSLINYNPGYNYIGIYTSAYSNARHWGGWEAKEWKELINLIRNYNPEYKFVLIGAKYDVGIFDEEYIKENFINTIGQPLPVVVEILKRLDCFIGFPSGLSIINETLAAKQTVMFYPKHLTKLINAWPDPKRIESGEYKGCLFCEPKKILDWLTENNKI